MSRRFLRIVTLLVVLAGVGGLVTRAIPEQAASAVTAKAVTLTANVSSDWDPTLVHLRFRQDPTPSPTPTPSPSAKPAQTRKPSTPTAATLPAIPPPAIQAQEIVLVNLDTGRFMWQSNSHMAWAPASLTKIFTAMVAVDLMGYNTTVTVPSSITSLPADSTFMGLTPGERLTVRDLLYGVFLMSGNDAAETLASAVTSRATFIADMNAKAYRLGLRTTHFTNPTGLDQAGHYSSAYDLAIASMYLESHYGSIVSIAATPSINIAATASHKAYKLVSIDKLLFTYPGVYGLKTGWTDAALGCLITTAYRGGHHILAVMLGAPAGTAYTQMPGILDYGFELLGVLPRPAAS